MAKGTTRTRDTGDEGLIRTEGQGRVTPDADHDRIVMASRRPDGTPAQFDPEFIGDRDTAIQAAKIQLAEQRVSALDTAMRGVTRGTVATGDDGEPDARAGSSDPDPQVQELIDAHKAAAEAAESQAESEVKAKHEGLGDR